MVEESSSPEMGATGEWTEWSVNMNMGMKRDVVVTNLQFPKFPRRGNFMRPEKIFSQPLQ